VKHCRMYLLLIMLAGSSCAQVYDVAFSVRVLDEDGLPVSNATLTVGFNRPKPYGDGAGEEVYDSLVTKTDTNGMCSVRGRARGSVHWGVEKEGYYRTLGMRCEFTNQRLGRLEPWEKVYEVTLRKRVRPTAMYARSLSNAEPPLRIPAMAQSIGFDLIRSDWVWPGRRGEVQDFVIRLDTEPAQMPPGYYDKHPRAIRHQDMTLTVAFTNGRDGLQSVMALPYQGSELRLPRFAPEGGYGTSIVSRYRVGPPLQNDMDCESQNYFFRIRSATNESGAVVRGLYGKIYGPFRYRPNGVIEFNYYVNPESNDRNMEYDPAKNLFEGLPAGERMWEP